MLAEYRSNSESETEAIAGEFAKSLAPGDVVALKGGLGAGKTAFTRGLAAGLGIKGDVTSPTFSLLNEYSGDDLTLYHFDMYRVLSFDSLYSTGFFDALDAGGIVAVEWSENIAGELPDNAITVTIERESETTRRITVTKGLLT